eukprot:jgi/Botrbrau1/21509/Bobra.174_2s0015.1
MDLHVSLALILIAVVGESAPMGSERRLQQAVALSLPSASGTLPVSAGGKADTSADRPPSQAGAASGPVGRRSSGLISGTSSESGLEEEAAQVHEPLEAPGGAVGSSGAESRQPQPKQQLSDNLGNEDAHSSSSSAATEALKKAGLLPFGHAGHGNVHFGSGGQAEYGLHKDDKETKQISFKEGVDGRSLGGGGYADYFAKTVLTDVNKDVGLVDEVVIPAGYADYGTPKLEIDVSWNKAGDSVICHFPSSLFQGMGANPYTVRPLTLPAKAAKAFLEKQKGLTFDFPAPPPGQTVFGPGCVQYDNNCDIGGNIACSGRGICESSLPNKCICLQGRATCLKGSNGCETNTVTDFERCGSCTNNCSASPLGYEACCNGECSDFDTPTNCGGCGNLCYNIGGNATCENKVCNIKCFADTPTKCTGPFNGSGLVLPNVTFCVNVNTSIFACGGCGYVCPTDPNGIPTCTPDSTGTPACRVDCLLGYTQCAPDQSVTSLCVNLRREPTNCGICGNKCPVPANGIAICRNGICDIQCNQGFARCGGVGGVPLQCQNLNSNVFNCGSCFRACNPIQDSVCENGQCLTFTFAGGIVFLEERRGNHTRRALPPEYYGESNARYFLPLHKQRAPQSESDPASGEVRHAAKAEEAPAAPPT